MQYNTSRSALPIPEYGRHVQRMIDHCKSIEDKEKRNQTAESIINVMGNLNPHLRDVPDFQHKLWDQLYVMADYDLDVTSPYPFPSKEMLNEKPESMPYPKATTRFKYYGKNISKMIEKALEWEDGDKKEALVFLIANQMKKCYLLWNKDTVDDKVIFNHLKTLSDDKLILDPEKDTLMESSKILAQNPPPVVKKSNYKRKKKR